jgi:hypothetical protein
MKKLLFPLCASIIAMVLGPSAASAATSASMAVSITVASSVTITIQSDASGLALGNSGTSAVSASLGTISAYGGVANQSSSNYTLTASCNSPIPPIPGRSVRPPSHPLPPLPLPPPAPTGPSPIPSISASPSQNPRARSATPSTLSPPTDQPPPMNQPCKMSAGEIRTICPRSSAPRKSRRSTA